MQPVTIKGNDSTSVTYVLPDGHLVSTMYDGKIEPEWLKQIMASFRTVHPPTKEAIESGSKEKISSVINVKTTYKH